ncbi:hypothetical protein QE152_g723 [Popillia japonica]|uniref:Uncharacterized protein n=1 Tax=Popillia japonica TaxID=7064 RepID=A0AAW1NIY3_POPJA
MHIRYNRILRVSKVTPICSLAAFTLNYAHQIQQHLTIVQPRVKPQNDVENVDHTKMLNKVNQAGSTLNYAHQIQQNLTIVQPRVKPQNDVENVESYDSST